MFKNKIFIRIVNSKNKVILDDTSFIMRSQVPKMDPDFSLAGIGVHSILCHWTDTQSCKLVTKCAQKSTKFTSMMNNVHKNALLTSALMCTLVTQCKQNVQLLTQNVSQKSPCGHIYAHTCAHLNTYRTAN